MKLIDIQGAAPYLPGTPHEIFSGCGRRRCILPLRTPLRIPQPPGKSLGRTPATRLLSRTWIILLKSSIYGLLVVAAASSGAKADDWFAEDKESWPATEYRKVENDFGAWLFVTPDLDWPERWSTPRSHIPHFRQADSLRVGDELAVLIFIINPATDEENQLSVVCDLRIIRPNLSLSVDEQDLSCLSGDAVENSEAIYLSPIYVRFIGDDDDPLGEWIIEVRITDKLRNISLELRKRLILEASSQ